MHPLHKEACFTVSIKNKKMNSCGYLLGPNKVWLVSLERKKINRDRQTQRENLHEYQNYDATRQGKYCQEGE